MMRVYVVILDIARKTALQQGVAVSAATHEYGVHIVVGALQVLQVAGFVADASFCSGLLPACKKQLRLARRCTG